MRTCGVRSPSDESVQMNPAILSGRRVLITQADVFMGPALTSVFAELGAEVVGDVRPKLGAAECTSLVAASGSIDTLLVHLAVAAPTTRAVDADEHEWRDVFAHLVDPMPPLVQAVLPQMIARGAGRILVIGSASTLRGMKRASTYSAARGAQLAYAQALGVELAPFGIRVNAIAQNFVDNPTYFPPDVQADPRFRERLLREVPLGRLVSAREDAMFAAYLCSDAADCFVGQVFPVSGGWAVR